MILLLYLLFPLTSSAPSQRGKCALDCYSKCLASGTASAVHCNCPLQKSFAPCTAVEERLNTAPIGTLAGASTEYLDAHSIRVKIGSVEGAFIYVFEYATISTAPDQWLFAGASSSPSISFTVMDPCRDYQFRVMAIVRPTTMGQNDVVIFRALPIPVNLPPFVLHPDQITVEQPVWNSSQVKVYVRWSLPRGYSDSDVYGYEAPAIYPVQCAHAPEEELPTPKIEIVRNGGRLAVWLPSRILETRCRLWAEVHMLPRCVRLEPFSVQKAIEIDCDRTPDLEACRHASADLQPECTDVIDIWGKHGEAIVMWQPPPRTPLAYSVRFGKATVQDSDPFVSWRILQPRMLRIEGNKTSISLKLEEGVDYGVQVCALFSDRSPKYDVVKVTPLMCKICMKNTEKSQKCGECAKIELSNEPKERMFTQITTTSVTLAPTIIDASADIFMQSNDRKKNASVAKQANTHRVATPLLLSGREGSGIVALKEGKEFEESTPTSSSGEIDTSTFDEIFTTLSAEGKDLFNDIEGISTQMHGVPVTVDGESLASSRVTTSTTTSTSTTPSTTTTTPSITTEKRGRVEQQQPVKISVKKVVEDKKSECYLSNGVRCLHGCELPTMGRKKTSERCICTEPQTVISDGSCHETHPSCLSPASFNATWDPSTSTVMISCLSVDEGANRLFVDIGAVTTKGMTAFIEPTTLRHRAQITIEPNTPDGLTHMLKLNKSIEDHLVYGIRVCEFRAGPSMDPMKQTWEKLGDHTIAIVDKLVSATTLAASKEDRPAKYDSYWSAFFTIGKIAILVALVLIMSVLVYLNCARLKMFYDRKKTRYFRPFVIDGKESRSIAARYPMGLPRTNPDLIGYPKRTTGRL